MFQQAMQPSYISVTYSEKIVVLTFDKMVGSPNFHK